MKSTIRKLAREISQHSKNIIKDKKYIHQYWITLRQKVKLPYVFGGVAVVSGLIAGLVGIRYWRNKHLPLTNSESKQLLKVEKIADKVSGKNHHRMAFLLDSLAVVSSIVSVVGMGKRLLKK